MHLEAFFLMLRFEKTNFRPISVLSAISKVFERCMTKQMWPFANQVLSNLLCGFRAGYSTQHALFRLIEFCRKKLDENYTIGMVLMDLSKAYDCLPHDLLIAKLEAYGFGMRSLRLIASYLSNRKQRVKIGSTVSDWQDIVCGVPQGSVLGPLLFNFFLNDFLLFIQDCDVCNFADDNTLFKYDRNIEKVALSLENDISNAIYWFKWNQMVANPCKFQVMFLGLNKEIEMQLNINNKQIKVVNTVKLLGITVDSKLKFDQHANAISKKANSKIRAFSRVSHYLEQPKAKTLYNTFIMSCFNYSPLIWMFCGKTASKEIDRIHKRALRLVLNDFDSPFETLLRKANECTIHQRNLQKLMLEIYKCLHFENPSFMWEFFEEKDLTYNLRTQNLLRLPPTRTETYGSNSLSFRGSILWNYLPDDMKNAQSVQLFKNAIRNWKGERCMCKNCK